MSVLYKVPRYLERVQKKFFQDTIRKLLKWNKDKLVWLPLTVQTILNLTAIELEKSKKIQSQS